MAGNGYTIEGTLLEACTCGVLCPCWVGEDADGGECWSTEAYHVDRGQIAGVDVSGLTYIQIEHFKGNILVPGSWRQVKILDAKGTEEQRAALLAAFRGEFGGPLADLADLVGEELGVEVMDIQHEIAEGKGRLGVGDGVVTSEMEPFRGPDGTITTLRDSLFSSVPGSPAWLSKSSRTTVNLPQYGFTWDVTGKNAIQAVWVLDYAG